MTERSRRAQLASPKLKAAAQGLSLIKRQRLRRVSPTDQQYIVRPLPWKYPRQLTQIEAT